MKKKSVIIGAIIIIIALLCNNSYAAGEKISTSLSQKETNEGKIQVEVSISQMESVGEGINAYSGELSFDSDKLSLVKIEGINGWKTPSYSEEKAKNGKTKVVSTSNNFINIPGTIFIATFEKKTDGDIEQIVFNNFEAAAKINGETIKMAENSAKDNNEMIQQSKKIDEYEKKETLNKKIWVIIGGIAAICLLAIGLLSLGFGIYKKNKGGK